jgi:hypothetical protein
MTQSSELLNQLMLGTQGSAAPSGDFAHFTPEQALLKQLALWGHTRRAGFVAKTAKSMPQIDPAPAETHSPCSLRAIDWLQLVESKASTRELAFDWFIFIKGRGKRVPLISLSYVLELSNRYSEWTPYIAPVIGERGKWIVQKTEFYPRLRQQELWLEAERPVLNPTKIDPKDANILEMHTRMMEELARE